MQDDLVVQMPVQPTAQLFLLFHGVGATPQGMVPLAQRLAQAFPGAAVVCARAPYASETEGSQWFSIAGITEETRPARVADAMPVFLQRIRAWQQRTEVRPAATALVGFSQGAIMALEATQHAEALLCGRVVALAGRFSRDPAAVGGDTTLHLIHGKHDPVVPYAHTVRAAEQLVALGSDVTADVVPFLRHEITTEVADLVIERLTGYVPQQRWREALRSAPGD